MKKKSKFFSRKNRKNQSLLANADNVRPSYYEAMEPESTTPPSKESIEARDEVNIQPKPKSSVPFQIARIEPESREASTKIKETKKTAVKEEMSIFDVDFPAKVSFQEDDWGHEVMQPQNRKDEAHQAASTEKDQTMKDKSLISFPSSGGDDIFDDLESVLEGVGEDDKFLNDFLAEGSQAEAQKSRSFRSTKDLNGSSNAFSQSNFFDNSNSSGNLLNGLTSPIAPERMNKMSKGILIVDPNKNGAVYHMDEDNKSLTDKDLIIIGQQRKSEADEQDDSTIMSSLTEVTYQKSKEERAKLIVKHLTDAVPDSNPFCSVFQCADLYPSSDDIRDALDNQQDAENAENELMKKAMATNGQQFSLTEDTGALIQSLFGGKVDYGSFDEKIFVCITRIYLALVEGGNDNGLRCTYNEPKLSHDLGVRLLEGNDGQAIVATVIPESTAERSGVQIGDKLSFSVPLNNTFQGYERACDFISRLELIGMRTSYRELFDMFLSKTSSGWPVAIVFRRQSEGMMKMKRMPFGLSSMDMSVDLLRATSCIHEIITCSREFDYELDSHGMVEIVRGNIESFMARPRCHDRSHKNDIQLEPSFHRIAFVPSNMNCKIDNQNLYSSAFRRSSLITWYSENSQAILYMRITKNKGGSGIFSARTQTGSWSAPCSINGHLHHANFQFTDEIDCIIFIKKIEDVKSFQMNRSLKIDMIEKCQDNLAITKVSGVFYIESRMMCTITVRDEINEMMYKKVKNFQLSKLLEGKVTQPDQATSFFGALRRLEFPSTMYPHPTPPINLSRYTLKKWENDASCDPSEVLEQPFDDEGFLNLRSFLRLIERGTKSYNEDKCEIDTFLLKFNRMLFDGVTVERTWLVNDIKESNDASDKLPTKALIKLWHLPADSWEEASLQFSLRGKQLEQEQINVPDFRRPLENIDSYADEFKLNDIRSISTILPKNEVLLTRKKMSEDEVKKRHKRFVSFEMKDGTQVMFYARTGKDAALLSCGLKLLLEKVQIHL